MLEMESSAGLESAWSPACSFPTKPCTKIAASAFDCACRANDRKDSSANINGLTTFTYIYQVRTNILSKQEKTGVGFLPLISTGA
jgi:hypothetical protein